MLSSTARCNSSSTLSFSLWILSARFFKISKHIFYICGCFFFARGSRKILRACEIETSSEISGNARKSSENRWKLSEVAGTFSEIPVMTRRKSHTFDSEKVGRYRNPYGREFSHFIKLSPILFFCLFSQERTASR